MGQSGRQYITQKVTTILLCFFFIGMTYFILFVGIGRGSRKHIERNMKTAGISEGAKTEKFMRDTFKTIVGIDQEGVRGTAHRPGGTLGTTEGEMRSVMKKNILGGTKMRLRIVVGGIGRVEMVNGIERRGTRIAERREMDKMKDSTRGKEGKIIIF